MEGTFGVPCSEPVRFTHLLGLWQIFAVTISPFSSQTLGQPEINLSTTEPVYLYLLLLLTYCFPGCLLLNSIASITFIQET